MDPNKYTSNTHPEEVTFGCLGFYLFFFSGGGKEIFVWARNSESNETQDTEQWKHVHTQHTQRQTKNPLRVEPAYIWVIPSNL